MGLCTRQERERWGRQGGRKTRKEGGSYKLAPAFPGLLKVHPLSMFKIFSGQKNLRQGREKGARSILHLPCPRRPEVQHRSAS